MRKRLFNLLSFKGPKPIPSRQTVTLNQGSSTPSPTSGSLDKSLNTVFDELCGSSHSKTLGQTGLLNLSRDLNLGERDIGMLIFLYHCRSVSLLDISRAEFIQGMSNLDVSDISNLKKRLPMATEDITQAPLKFMEFFKYVYQACREGSIKTIPKENAMYLLPICLSESDSKHRRYVEDFVNFLRSQSQIQNIKFDEWVSFLNFSLQTEDISLYDSGGHWPLIIDSFVEWKHEQT